MEHKEFKTQAHSFIVALIEFVEKFSSQSDIFKRVLYEGLQHSHNFEDLSSFLNSLNQHPASVAPQHLEMLLDVCNQAAARREDIFDVLKTVRLLASQNYSQWDEFYTTLGFLNAHNVTLSEFLMTIRHFQEVQYKEWGSFFKMIKSLEDFRPQHVSALLTAFRHAIQYFKTENSLRGITRVLSSHPQFTEAFSYGQLDSKTWLMDKAISVWGKDWGRVFVLAGWIGVLPRFIFEYDLAVSGVRSFDIDPSSTPVAEMLNQAEVQEDWKFKAATVDICQMQFPATFVVKRKDGSTCELTETPDVIINTSCEHLPNLAAWWAQIPKGSKVILQSNDGFHIEGHVACFKTLKDFETAMNLSQIDYSGEKVLPEFNRFMIIGKK